MDDAWIVELYWKRSENAIAETSAKYGNYCYSIAYNILADAQEAEESVNDTYLDAWNAMPPHRPTMLSTFLGKITRRISIDKWRGRMAEKRGGGEIVLALDELSECISSGNSVESTSDINVLGRAINAFVLSLPDTERRVFICRYWYLDTVSEISRRFGFSQSKVKTILFRTRGKLLSHLEKEGVAV